MTQPLPSIAFVGAPGSGKSTLAAQLVQHGFNSFSWAGPVRSLFSWAYGPANKARAYEITMDGKPTQATGRQLLQRMATEGIRKHVDEDFWVRVGLNSLDEHPEYGPWTNDDTRFPNELEALARRGWVIVRVECPTELREARLVSRDGQFDPSDESHPSEGLIGDQDVHLTIWNTADPHVVIETLLETIQSYVAKGGAFVNRNAQASA